MAIPPDIEYVISEWRKFLIRSTTYKWHGVLGKCPKDFYMVVNYIASAKDKTPPIFYDYHFSGPESQNGLVIYPKYSFKYFQDFYGGIFLGSPLNPSPRYDTLFLDWYISIDSGAVEFSGAGSGFTSCLQGSLSGVTSRFNYAQFIFSTLFSGSSKIWDYTPFSVSNQVAFQRVPFDPFWICKGSPNPLSDWSFIYRLEFKKNISTGKYDFWDNCGKFVTNIVNPRINVYQRAQCYQTYGGGIPPCYYNWQIYVDRVSAYSGNFE